MKLVKILLREYVIFDETKLPSKDHTGIQVPINGKLTTGEVTHSTMRHSNTKDISRDVLDSLLGITPKTEIPLYSQSQLEHIENLLTYDDKEDYEKIESVLEYIKSIHTTNVWDVTVDEQDNITIIKD